MSNKPAAIYSCVHPHARAPLLEHSRTCGKPCVSNQTAAASSLRCQPPLRRSQRLPLACQPATYLPRPQMSLDALRLYLASCFVSSLPAASQFSPPRLSLSSTPTSQQYISQLQQPQNQSESAKADHWASWAQPDALLSHGFYRELFVGRLVQRNPVVRACLQISVSDAPMLSIFKLPSLFILIFPLFISIFSFHFYCLPSSFLNNCLDFYSIV